MDKLTRQLKREIAEYVSDIYVSDYDCSCDDLEGNLIDQVCNHFHDRYPDLDDEIWDYVSENLNIKISCTDGPI